MSSDYDFKYRLKVSFKTPDDVLSLVKMLAKKESDYDDEYCFHPALVNIESDDHLCLVENEGVLFNEEDDAEIHTYGEDDDTDLLDDLIKEIKDSIPGISINGYITVICNAQDVTFTFYKNSIQIDCLDDDEIAEMYERDIGILETKEE